MPTLKYFAALLLMAPANVVLAVEEAANGSPRLVAEPMAAGNLVQLTLGMAAVLAVIGLLSWLLRRSGHFQSGVSGSLKILGGVSMGSRERVVLLQVGEQQLVLGVAPGRVQTLHVLDKPIPVDGEGHALAGGNFAQAMKMALGKGKEA